MDDDEEEAQTDYQCASLISSNSSDAPPPQFHLPDSLSSSLISQNQSDNRTPDCDAEQRLLADEEEPDDGQGVPTQLTKASGPGQPMAEGQGVRTNILTLTQESSGDLLKCSICNQFRPSFYCYDCIQKGDFTSSRSEEILRQRFAEKKLRFYELQEEQKQLNEQLQLLMANDLETDNLKFRLREYTDSIEALKVAIGVAKSRLVDARMELSRAMTSESQMTRKTEKIAEKKLMARKYVEHRKQSIAKRTEIRERLRVQLKDLGRERVSQLCNYIFPIEAYLPDENPETGGVYFEEDSPLLTFSGSDATVAESVASTGLKFNVVEPWLPASGDYSNYDEWVALHKDLLAASSSLSELGRRNDALRISGALSYASHLLNSISFFLDMHNPKRLTFNEFYTRSNSSGNEMFLSEHELKHRVAKLNLNIIHALIDQNISLGPIHPRQTIQNLQLLIQSEFCDQLSSQSGQQTPTADLIEAIDTALGPYLAEEDLPDMDWEAIPHMPVLTHSQSIPDQFMYSQAQTSLAGGFVSTAAASFASIWRTYTGQK